MMDHNIYSRLTSHTRKNSPIHTPYNQELSSFGDHICAKKENYVIPKAKIKLQSLGTFSIDKEFKLKRAKFKMTDDSRKSPFDHLQKEKQKNSSKIRKSPLKNQNKEQRKSNKLLLSILLSHMPNQQQEKFQKTRQFGTQLQGRAKNTHNTNQFYSQQKLNCFFSDVLKVKKCPFQQNQVIAPATLQPKEAIFRHKHIVQKSHHFGHLVEKKHRNLTKKDLSLVTIKKYPFSTIKLQEYQLQVKKIQSFQLANEGIIDQQKQRNKNRTNRIKQNKEKDCTCMQPWGIQDQDLLVGIDEFL